MAGSFVSIAFFILLVFLCVKGVMWGASLIVLVQGTVSCLVISLIILFALPEGSHVVGPNIPYLPISVSAVLLVSAVLSIVVAQRNRKEATGNHHKAGIAVLTVGVALWVIGFLVFCLFVFGELDVSTLSRTQVYAAFFIASKASGASYPLAECARWRL